MTDETASALEADPETVTEGQDGENEAAEAETEQPEKAEPKDDETPDEKAEDKKPSASKERRERDKALKARLHEEREAALTRAKAAEERHARILEAGEAIEAPKEDDFADFAEFVAAKAVWKYSQGSTEREAGQATQEAEAARKEAEQITERERAMLFKSWQDSANEARTRYTDFDAVVNNQDVPIPLGVAELIWSSDYAGDVAYRLASNPQMAADIAKLPPVEAARAIGRIEAQITAPKPRTSSTAPEPITPVKASAQAQRDPSKMTYAEYKKWRSGK